MWCGGVVWLCGYGWPGIDKPDVCNVIFYNLLQLLLQFHHSVGWACRDGWRADSVIFWNMKDRREVLNVQRGNGNVKPNVYAHPHVIIYIPTVAFIAISKLLLCRAAQHPDQLLLKHECLLHGGPDGIPLH